MDFLFSFFLKYRAILFINGDVVLRTSWPVVFLLFLAVAGAAVAVASYARPKGKAETADRVVMALLRFGAFAVLFFALLRPTLVNTSTVPQRNFVGVLLDDSRSMTLPGVGGAARSAFIEEQLDPEEGDLFRELEERFAVRYFRYSSSTDRVELASDLTYDGTRTDLVGALDRVREELSSVPLSGLVVISDGADNSGRPLAEAMVPLQAASVPVYSVGLGEESLTPDIQVGRVSAPRTVLVGTSLLLDVVISQRGFAGQTLPLVVEDDESILTEEGVRFGGDGEPTVARVRFTLDDAGSRRIRVRVPVQDGERVSQNNERSVEVEVREAREKILYFDGEPRPEVKFLRRAVEDDEEVDELMERLKELARRQQQELERQRRRADAQQGATGGSGGDSQRALAEEAEETARQLEELARRTGDQQLAEIARRLQEAAETMRRSAAGSGQSQGLADAASALDDLEEAQRRLERDQESRMQEGIQGALDRVNRLAESQERVREEVEQLPDDPSARRAEVQQIHEQKDEMVRETGELERDLIRMQQSARRESREAAAELNEAVEAIQEGRLEEKLAYTKGVVEQREREFALEWEDQISSDIQALREEVEDVARAFEEGTPNRDLEEALEEARELARGAESLGRRLENRGALGQSDPGQEGQEGQQGQQGQEGQQGQQGQGRQGQQGGRGGERTGEEVGQRVQGSPFGGAVRGNPRPFIEEEIRQYTREFAQRLAQAQELRETLVEAGRDVPDLEEAMEALETLRDPEVYGDLPQIALLQEQIRENLRRVEFLLRREVEGESAGRAALSGTDDVPSGFRRMVEEYFKNLARGGGAGSGGGGV